MNELSFQLPQIRQNLPKERIAELISYEFNIDELEVSVFDMLIAVELLILYVIVNPGSRQLCYQTI